VGVVAASVPGVVSAPAAVVSEPPSSSPQAARPSDSTAMKARGMDRRVFTVQDLLGGRREP
jgi:hypothetical protein